MNPRQWQTTTTNTVTSISKVEADKIKAETSLLKQQLIFNWITRIIQLIIGLILLITGFTLFLKSPNNYYNLGLMLLGGFLLSGSKTEINEYLKLHGKN